MKRRRRRLHRRTFRTAERRTYTRVAPIRPLEPCDSCGEPRTVVDEIPVAAGRPLRRVLCWPCWIEAETARRTCA